MSKDTKFPLIKKVPKNVFFFFLFIFLPSITCNFITVKLKGTEESQFFINPIKERQCPDKIYLNEKIISQKTCKYNFTNKIITIKLKWDKTLTNFYRLFSNISNILEVDFSYYDTSLVKNMSYMFDNCKDLIYVNLSNRDLSSVRSANNMFSNCFSLKRVDLTNVHLDKIPKRENIFKNCIHLNKKNNFNFNFFNKRLLQETICDKNTMFDSERTCTINTQTANQEIIEGLDTEEYREYLINLVNEKNIIEASEDKEIFSITTTQLDEKIQIGRCQAVIRMIHNISDEANLYLYRHEVKETYYMIPIINYIIFDTNHVFDISQCTSPIQFILPVTVDEDNLYLYKPNSEYYSDNCSELFELSIYDRKKEYNDKNLSLCQANCYYNDYNYYTKAVTCDCPAGDSNNQNGELLHKFILKEEDKDKCVIVKQTGMTEYIKYCDIYEIFNQNRDCTINLETANQDIIEGLDDETFRNYLINEVLNNNNEISITENIEMFNISKSNMDETLRLGRCEEELKDYYRIANNETLYLYKHGFNILGINIPIIFYEIFKSNIHFNLDRCKDLSIQYIFPVTLNEDELYKYDPNSEYYSDNCSVINELSIYDRKKEYNDKNLSLCQAKCNFSNYDTATKKVTCDCPGSNTNTNNNKEALSKFELNVEDKYKCSNQTLPGNKTKEQQLFEDIVSGIASNKTGKEKADIFDNMLDAIMTGSLNNIVEEIVNNGQDLVTSIDGDTYHLTTIKQQFYTEHLTAVDLGSCEQKLRETHDLGDQELLIFKIEHNVPSFKIPIIEYVLLTEDGRVNIDLTACEGILVNYLIPVDIDGDKLFLYDPNNEFYTDKCHPHTSEDGTDMTLFDRKNEYNVQNMSLCEDGCDYDGYNKTTKKTKCICPIKTERNFFEIDQNKLLNKFKNYKDVINIMIIKCYQLVFSSKGLKTNIGSYILISIAGINGALIAVFYLKGFANLKTTMKDIFNKSFKEKVNNEKNQKDKYNKDKDKKKEKEKGNKNNKNNFPPKKKEKHHKKSKHKKNKKDKNKKTTGEYLDSIENLNENNNKEDNKDKNIKPLEKKNTKKRESIKKRASIKKTENIIKFDEKRKSKEFKGEDEIIYLNDNELNSLSFDDALKYETRTYWQYYISLIKTKELIVFTFYTKTDYNSRQLKIILFLLSFALFYTVNALFFNDSTMHQIYEDEGTFNFVYQIPQILYSTIISTVIKMIISFLSLTESTFIKLKNKKSKKLALKELGNILKCISKKCIAFFILCYFFNLIFWYYLACFCAVYKNTQTYLIKDTVISLCTSLLYPFGFNLLPGLFRMPAIKRKSKCLYIISNIFALL